MRVLIAGGSGFLGSALAETLRSRGDEVVILTRRTLGRPDEVHWDGQARGPWIESLESVDAVVNATGYGLEHWPWSGMRKRRFVESRVTPAHLLAAAVAEAHSRPHVFVQFSGTNFYGLAGDQPADEFAAPGTDFLARLAVQWEAASKTVEDLGVRWIAARNAVVLADSGGLLPLMSLSARMLMGGRLGPGNQPIPWIHLTDTVGALLFLLGNDSAKGAYNLVAPTPTLNDTFMRAVAQALHRPYWLPVPASLLRLALGEMADLILGGRVCLPKRIIELGYRFTYPHIDEALRAIF